MNNPADQDAARAVRQAVDALSGDQPQVQDWPLWVRRAVARRRKRRAAAITTAVTALAVVTAGGAAALGQREDALIAAPAPRGAPGSATPTPTPSDLSVGATAAPSPRPAVPPASSSSPAATPTDPAVVAPVAPSAKEEPPVQTTADRRCAPRPQSASRSSLKTAITFPATPVRRGTSGVLTVRNDGATAVSLPDREYLPTASVEGEFLTSAYAVTGDAVAGVPLEPGQERRFRVSVSGYVCERGQPNYDKEIGAGRYQLVALIPVNDESLASEPIEIVYEP